MPYPTSTRTIIVRERPFEPEPNPEDALTNKIMACLPIIGTSRAHRISASIDTKIQNVKDLDAMIQLIKLKNQYKALAIARMVLITSFLFYVGGEEWGPAFLCALSIGFLPSLWVHGRNIFYNRQTINALETNDLSAPRPIL